MIKVVIDTNVLVSAVLTSQGNEAKVMDLIASGKLSWCLSDPVLGEYQRVLIEKLGFDRLHVQWCFDLAKQGHLVVSSEVLTESPDETDNRFYECAAASCADFIVTGNIRHFKKPYKGTRIVTARQLLEFVGA
jgi:putative PIN family toxin of toxin-antitoxin system